MAVISLTIVESSTQIISGIPVTIEVTANIPSNIFYTLDGTEPTSSSLVYLGPIKLPTNVGSVTLKLYATNGSDSSTIITKEYGPNIMAVRQFYDTVSAGSSVSNNHNIYPFGDSSIQLPIQYNRMAGDIVDSLEIENVPDGYDSSGTGTYSNGTDASIDSYDLIFSETNSKGERGHGIGTLPSKTTIRAEDPQHPGGSSRVSDKLFNPRAAVIYQDSSEENANPDILQINRQSFSLENAERVRDGATLMHTTEEKLVPTGNFVRAIYNPTENKIIYYYFDSATLRWIISREPYVPKKENPGYVNIVFSPRDKGNGIVFKWIPFARRRLI